LGLFLASCSSIIADGPGAVKEAGLVQSGHRFVRIDQPAGNPGVMSETLARVANSDAQRNNFENDRDSLYAGLKATFMSSGAECAQCPVLGSRILEIVEGPDTLFFSGWSTTFTVLFKVQDAKDESHVLWSKVITQTGTSGYNAISALPVRRAREAAITAMVKELVADLPPSTM
jgi:hypothetical protein